MPERMVEMAGPLAAHLKALQARRLREAFNGGEAMSPCVVSDPTDPERASRRLRQDFARTLKRAELPGHFTPHAMRHTFCSLLVAAGVSPVYVQQQAGHASVDFTVRV